MKIHHLFLFFVLFSSKIVPAPLGWFNQKKVANRVFSYSVPNNNTNSKNGFYIATSHLKKPWKRNQTTKIVLKLHYINDSLIKRSDIIEIKLGHGRILFPINLSVASYGKKILVAWQETSLGKQIGSRIKLIYSPDGPENFQAVQELDDSINQKTAILPRLLAGENGKFHVFYQKETSNNKFTMFHSSSNGEKFTSVTKVVGEIEDVGRGAFFPSITARGDRFDIFYQNKLKKLPKDEIFHVQSNNNGRTFGSPTSLTNNTYSDFSPFGSIVQNKVELVWQAHLDGTWTILHLAGAEPKKITHLKTDAYSPNIVYIKDFGRVVTWYDFRENPPQIYAVFLDKPDIQKIGKAHNVSQTKSVAMNPTLTKWKNSAYLFYTVQGRLYFKKVDSGTSKIQILSKTHPERKFSKKTTGIFKFKIPEEPSGVSEIAWLQDEFPNSIPEVYNLSSTQRKIELNGFKGGNYYLHARYKDNIENESSVTHYNFIVDNENPTAPIISSSTHKEKAQSINKNISFEFISSDDSKLQYYEYVFSTNRAARFDKKTKEESISFNDVEPSIYFLKVRAVDIAGNNSPISTYRVEIIYPEDRVSLYTNIESQQLKDNFFNLEYVYPDEESKLIKAYFVIGSKKIDPYKKGEEIALETTSEGQRLLVPMFSYRKKRLYTISFGFDYQNGRRGKIKFYSFEFLGSTVSKPKTTLQDLSLLKPTEENISNKERIPKKKTQRKKKHMKKEQSSIEAIILTELLDPKNNLYKISFSIEKAYKDKIKGYSWNLAGDPKIPNLNKVNSKGGPEYVYRLKPGVYYLTALPIFKNWKFNKKASYAYQRIILREKYFFEGKVLLYALILSGIFFLGFMTFHYRRISFYLNSIAKS